MKHPRTVARELGKKRYFTGVPCPRGHVAERLIESTKCVECVKAKTKERFANNREAVKAARRRYHRANTVMILLTSARARAKQQRVPFNLRREDVTIPTHCPVFGMKLEIGPGKVHSASPTLDKIRPELGYVRGNVAVISYKANRLKSNATPDDLETVARWLRAQTR